MKKASPKMRHLRVYERRPVFPQSIAYYQEIIYLQPREFPYVANYWEYLMFSRGDVWWARDVDYLKRLTLGWFKIWLTYRKERQKIYHRYRRDRRDLQKVIVPLVRGDINKLSNKSLWSCYRAGIDFALRHLSYGELTLDCFDDFFAGVFTKFLSGNYKHITSEDLSAFLQPATLSKSAEYQRVLLRLSLQTGVTSRQLLKIVRDYSWVKMGWDGSNELTIKNVRTELGVLRRVETNKRELELEKIDDFRKRTLERRHFLIRKYNFSVVQLAPYFDLLDAFNYLHDYRKEIQMRCNQLIYCVLREISTRFTLPYDDLLWYLNTEVEGLLLNGNLVTKTIIEKRKKGLGFLVRKGKVTRYVGSEALDKLEKLVLSVTRAEHVDVFRGLPASRGTITGKVFVCKDAQTANRELPKGEILVASMTTVDFLPAMRRAGGIITDDGGATCHAAVVSREFGIPCVVGTKVATQVLKTGYVIEVDANKGVIKIISRQ